MDINGESLLLTRMVNYEAEQALLGAVLTNNEVYDLVADLVQSADFADPFHGRVYEACGQMIESGAVADPLTLMAPMAADPEFEKQGGIECLIRLAGSVVTVVGADGYAKAIHDLAMRRALYHELLKHARALAFEDQDARQLDEIIGAASASLDSTAGTAALDSKTKREVAEELVEQLRAPFRVHKTELTRLDDAMGGGLLPGRMYGFGARKKVGKSLLATTISNNLARQECPHLFVTLEMSPVEIEARSAARALGVNAMRFLPGARYPIPAADVADYAVKQNGVVRYIHKPGIAFARLKECVLIAIRRDKIAGVIVDYWQLVGGRDRRDTQEQHQGEVAGWLSNTARDFGIWVVLMCQLNQEGNARGGEGIRMACDQYYVIHKPENGESVWVEMQDSRYTPYGDIGSETEPGLMFDSKIGPHFRDW